MPIHDWKKVDAGLFHHFHQSWICTLADAFNTGGLPPDHYALIERNSGIEPRIVPSPNETECETYSRLANQIGVRTKHGNLIAAIEIVSPGNKDRDFSIGKLIEKTLDFLSHGVHVLVIDLFPPTPRDPLGIHRAIWEDVREDDYTPPTDKPLTLVSYVGEPLMTAYVEAAAVGDPLPSMPIFLDEYSYVPAPLEETYMRTWEKCPKEMKSLVLGSHESAHP